MHAATIGTAPPAQPLTREAIQRMAQLLQEMDGTPWDGVEAWMCGKGFPPAMGCAIVLPAAWRDAYGAFAPNWVRFSNLVSDPTLLNLRAMGMEGLGNG